MEVGKDNTFFLRTCSLGRQSSATVTDTVKSFFEPREQTSTSSDSNAFACLPAKYVGLGMVEEEI
ncbi:unnamed protein product [Coffea canephora]|uniref:Uncharacterized protein n=1 Tax=Coffea canephora TaxID=49390 RepID=A0A068U969_COFCA|nr:unnamed protein product [Coffea canephora]